MPKEKRRRSAAHEQSVKLRKRQFAAQDNAVEHVDVGEQAERPASTQISIPPTATFYTNDDDRQASDILADMTVEEQPRPIMKKKEKQALKHELFLKRLEQSRSPYSKSHERRLKRKAKEQVAGGMDDITAAIFAVEDAIPTAVQNTIAADAQEPAGTDEPRTQARTKPQPGQIGEGKGVPLSKNQRKRALQVERMRIPLILATPEFSANPFQTIRTHAQNTLVKHEPPSAAP
ncbi:ribosome biogenesis protein SLX9-domain-containing protein [Trametes gibbosa]|nr:ribosome biogenesis protein SLX9-domain-containing protein [Trametes gibbosa]